MIFTPASPTYTFARLAGDSDIQAASIMPMFMANRFTISSDLFTMFGLLPKRERLVEDRHHLTGSGKFQSDKYEWASAGYLPIKVGDPLAKDLLIKYALRSKDVEFSKDLLEAVSNADLGDLDEVLGDVSRGSEEYSVIKT